MSSLCWRLPIFPDRHQSSIVGTSELNFRVRNGNGWTLTVKNTNYVIGINRYKHINFSSPKWAHTHGMWYTFRDSNPGHPD